MESRLRRDAQGEVTRRRLLDAARRVFLRRGFHGTSLDLIADEAGFTKGAVYSRFKSKADLFLVLVDERYTERVSEMEALTASAHGTIELGAALRRKWDTKLRVDEEWSLLLVEFRVHAARDAALNRRYGALHAKLRDGLAAAIGREAEESGETLPISAVSIARAALALANGSVLERVAEGGAFPADLTHTLNRALLQGLRTAATTRSRRSRPRARRK